MINPRPSFLGDASGKISPTILTFSAGSWTSEQRFYSKAKNPPRALQWIKEIEAAKSLKDLITPKSVTGKDFLNYEELEKMMAAALKRCYGMQTHFRELRRTTDFS